jgi:hypothetical protein
MQSQLPSALMHSKGRHGGDSEAGGRSAVWAALAR